MCAGAHACGGDFNPRSPHGERRFRQLLLPALRHFNPRSPHGERHGGHRTPSKKSCISIHAPRTGSDAAGEAFFRHLPISIHAPRTGSDWNADTPVNPAEISIHAPRTGSDRWTSPSCPRRKYFNPRSPHGERPARITRRKRWTVFQSTLPARGATQNSPPDERRSRFQSTLPARGATRRKPVQVD